MVFSSRVGFAEGPTQQIKVVGHRPGLKTRKNELLFGLKWVERKGKQNAREGAGRETKLERL